jgi:Ca2+-binding EF-hand superfamily protein
MKHIILKIIALSFIAVFQAAIAGAVHDLFRTMDTDNSGSVSREEFSRYMEKDAFDRLDADKNGILTMDEWKKMDYLAEGDKQPEVFRHVDKNANKKISFPEFTNYADKYSNIEEAFMTMDKNKDGSLSPDEVTLRPLFRLITIRH